MVTAETIEDEEMKRGQRPWLPSSGAAGRGRGILPTDRWPLETEVKLGRAKVNPGVDPTGYGRLRSDAGAYPMDEIFDPPAGRALAWQ